MNNNQYISKELLEDVFKKKWWVVFACCFVAILLILFQHFFLSNTDIGEKYATQSMVYIELRSDDNKNGADESVVESRKNIIKSIDSISSSRVFEKTINQKLIANGFSKYKQDADKLVLGGDANVIEFEVLGNNKKRIVFLSNTYAELITKKLNPVLSSVELKIVDRAINSSCKFIPATKGIDSLFSVKNIFLLFLSILCGFIILTVTAFTDKKIHSYYDITSVFNIPYLGKIGGMDHLASFKRLAVTTREIAARKKIDALLFITVNSNDEMDTIIDEFYNEIAENEESVETDLLKAILENSLSFEQYVSWDNVIVLVKRARDYKEEVFGAINTINVTERNIVGFIIVE